MTAITRDYYCTACRRVHRIVSLVGQAHKTFNEFVMLRDPGDPFTARPEVPLRAGVRLDGSPGLREPATGQATGE